MMLLVLIGLIVLGIYGFYLAFVKYDFSKVVSIDSTSVKESKNTTPNEAYDLNYRLENYIKTGYDIFRLDEKTADIVLCFKKFGNNPVILSKHERQQHMQIMGPTGSGKSMMAQTLIAQDLMNPNIGIFVLEPKGGPDALVYQMKFLSERIKREVFLIDPTNPDTFIISPFSGSDLDEIAEINVSAFLMYLGPTAEQFYKNKQENALRMAVKAVKLLKGEEATYDDVLNILRKNSTGDAMRRECLSILSSDYNYLKHDLEEYHNELYNNPKAQHYYSGLIDYLKKLTSNQYIRNILCVSPEEKKEKIINLRSVLNNAGVVLITTAVHTTKHLGYTIGRLYLSMLQSEIFYRMKSNDKKVPVACYIDEVQNYANESFAEVFEMGRSANFMVTVIHHNFEQLRQVSPRLEQAVFTNARQKVIFGGINTDDAERIANQIGKQYQPVYSFGLEPNETEEKLMLNKREELRWIVTPTEIVNLPGFQSETGEPAQVLCLLNINNKPSHLFGKVYPVNLEYLKPINNYIHNNIKEQETAIRIRKKSKSDENQTYNEDMQQDKKIVQKKYITDEIITDFLKRIKDGK
ncbi:AAA-like domain-containing protein [Thermoanaerobacter thermohydrosulfuricus]|uniref:AAA-like domain-containing protein n=1 Tax=Thermoanaerobacter thermohydrosulfuricus TaxID=1516 RepID=A0A1G7WAZ5_THETY|nr:type IV secretory system conjugative DNA transfer family protein [Thermoanaerobacter thermohydrosulfuricus]SDG69173.1 AAA-like domain-containing protein [Thermoanaerobacter thermohydrosulfuricus]